MFSILAQNQLRGWQNFEKKLSRQTPRQFFFSKFCHPCRRFWAKIENMISPDYVLCYIPWALETLDKNENFVIVEQGGGGPFVVLEIWEKNSEFGSFFPKFWKFENFQNFELKFPKSEANFDAGRGISVENF